MTNVAVIFGGQSVEHEISILSALQAIEQMDKSKYTIYPVYYAKNGEFYYDESFTNVDTFKDLSVAQTKANIAFVKTENGLMIEEKSKKMFKKGFSTTIDFIFPIVHGTGVEDGTLQGFIKTFDVPFAGPSVISGVTGQDKAIMKDILKANDVSQLKYCWFTDELEFDDIVEKIEKSTGFPAILKPALLGSSVGITVAKSKDDLERCLDETFRYTNKVVVEEYLEEFEEMNISLVGSYKDIKFSAIEKVAKSDEILSYEDKYMSSNNKKGKVSNDSRGMASLDRIIPAPISDELEKQIQDVARDTFVALNASGVVRIDLIIKDEVVYINEINNIPGSLSFYLWKEVGIDFTSLLDNLIDLGVSRYYDEKQKVSSFETNVLAMHGKGGVKK